LVVVGFIGAGWYWRQRLAVHRDEVRLAAVEDIMQDLIQLRVNDPEQFSQLIGQASAHRVMVGGGPECVDYYYLVHDLILEVGACEPEARAEIKLEYQL
jgi:protein-S-isoprenylcysteine O-methyltransferase Ste14